MDLLHFDLPHLQLSNSVSNVEYNENQLEVKDVGTFISSLYLNNKDATVGKFFYINIKSCVGDLLTISETSTIVRQVK